MFEADGSVINRARIYDGELGKALVKQARQVARLQQQRRKLKATLRAVEFELKTAKRFLRGLTQDREAR
jgi:hypothetical protein